MSSRGDAAGDAGPVAVPLITAKLARPEPPPGAIARPRLHALLEGAARARLGLVVAPAGFGKTVAVSQWLAARPPAAVAWLSLDEHDDQPARFWAYLLAALARAGLPAGPWAGQLIAAAGDPPEQALAGLVNALTGQQGGMVLVLDNTHLISDQRIHHPLGFLLDQQLPSFHLLALARADPPFATARQLASGQVVQARAADLAFTGEELTAFLASQHVALAPGLAGPLHARLRGWPAAARLVTLWLGGHQDPAAALAGFAASDTTIADYLTTEVLAQLPARRRRFLLATSILAQLTGPLCEAVTGQRDGAATLASLYRAGLFTDPAGPSGDWYRYHDLFRELLAAELRRTRPAAVPGLHQRAAAWFAVHGYASEAISHGLAASDWPAVQALITAEILAIGSHYHPAEVEGWLAALPPPVREASPLWLTLHAFTLTQLGQLPTARRALARAAGLAAEHGPDPSLPELAALRHAIAASIARLDCDLPTAQQCHQDTERELSQLGGSAGSLAAMARAAAANAAAAALFWHGDLPAARELLHHLDGETAGHQLMRMRAACLALTALLAATTGQLRHADTLTAQALDLAAAAGVASMFQATPALLATAVTALHRGDRTRAQEQAAEAASRARRHADRGPLLAACLLQARLATLRGDPARALELLTRPAAFDGWQPPAALHAQLLEEHARACLASGDLSAAHAAGSQLHALPHDNPVVRLAAQATRARLLHADGHPGDAAARYAAAADTALACGQLPRAVETLTEAAAASHAAGQAGAAASYLGQALTLAAAEEITLPFTQAPSVIQELLAQLDQHPGGHPVGAFRQHLLALTGIPAPPPATSAPPPPGPLSDRERAVLRLLHGSLSNTEIAAALGITPNTLKTHIRHLYRKLGATTRHQALSRARDLRQP